VNVSAPALRAAVLKVLLDAISDQLNTAKHQSEAAFTETGTTQAVPQLPDGTKIATVSLAGGDKNAAFVDDEQAFEAWVLSNHPEQCELVIRPEYRKGLLDAAKEAGKAVDPSTGEAVPGIAVQPAKPYVSVRFKPGGKEAVAEAWRRGQLTEVDIVAPAAIGDAA
jgi:hypothetical protein